VQYNDDFEYTMGAGQSPARTSACTDIFQYELWPAIAEVDRRL